MSTERTKCMAITKDLLRCKLVVEDRPIEQISQFKYLGIELSRDHNLPKELKSFINKLEVMVGCLRKVAWTNRNMRTEESPKASSKKHLSKRAMWSARRGKMKKTEKKTVAQSCKENGRRMDTKNIVKRTREITSRDFQNMQYALKWFDDTGSHDNRQRIGRKRVTTTRGDRRLIRESLRNRKKTLFDLAADLTEQIGRPTFARTAKRSAGVKGCKTPEKPLLSDKYTIACYKLARKHQHLSGRTLCCPTSQTLK
ncbi:hypothetical protein ILUMI_06905 [Ignelater luminosus]|uniref:Uncharacterized protein n=1 Tax=Ignelater luminosus TaxID=2038154 RepID=A0A8K0D9B4_IGNLU|nr:hypothetical protein ILUMI_06905 [Ignelater luminosus]